jgi:replication factor A1
MSLTPGAIRNLYRQPRLESFQPVLQVLSCTALNNGRDRCVLSDGAHSTQVLLSKEATEYQKAVMLKENQLIRVQDFHLQDTASCKIVLLDRFEPLTMSSSKIGNPSKYEEVKTAAPSYAPAPAAVSDTQYTPIRTLTQFNKDWVIKARVSNKSEIRQWNNTRGSGRYFTVNLIDMHKDEITATFFNEGCDKYYNLVEEGRVYTFANGTVKLANRKYQSVGQDYSLTFDKQAQVEAANDDGTINSIKFNFISLEGLKQIPPQSIVDICAVANKIGGLEEFTSKKGAELKRRNLLLIDHSNFAIELTLWGENAQDPIFSTFGPDEKPIIAVKSARVSDFKEKSLSVDKTSKILWNPEDIEECVSMRNWRDTYHAISSSVTLLSNKKDTLANINYKTLEEIKAIGETRNPKLDEAYSTYVHIGYFKHEELDTMMYPACTNPACKNKKVVQEGDYYSCSKCHGKTSDPEWRYMLNVRLHDNIDTLWATAFDESVVKIIGIKAKEFRTKAENNTEFKEEKSTESFGKQFYAKIKVSISPSERGPMPKYSVLSLSPINVAKQTELFLSEINSALSTINLK